MRELHVVDNAGSVGFVSPSDRRGFELHPQAWTGMNSVRTDEGGIEPAWGYAGTGIPLLDNANSLDYMSNSTSDENWYVVGSDATIDIHYVETDTGVYTARNIGSGYFGTYATGDVWVTAVKDGHLVMTNGIDRPQMILQAERAAVVAAELTGFAAAPSLGQDNYVACKTIIAFRGFLVAGNITFANDGRKPQMVAWSDRTDTGTLPDSWDYADPATLAGNVTLPADYGDIVALQEIRDELMIYCERGAYRMQWVGGQYVFRIVAAYDTVGCINPRALCSNKGTNILVTFTDIVRTDGQYPVSIANGTVRKELFDQLAPGNSHKIQVIEYPKKSEIVIICPDKQDDLWCGKQLVWNWSTETWMVRHGLLMRCMANVPKLVSAIDPENIEANSSYDEIWRSAQVPPITDGTTEPPEDEQLQLVSAIQFVAEYQYVREKGETRDGRIVHEKINSSLYVMKISKTDYTGTDRSADLANLDVGSTISASPPNETLVWTIDVIEDMGTWVYVQVSPPETSQYASWLGDFTFDIPPAWEIPVNPIDQAQDNYAAVTSTYGTQLADEGVLYMFGIATAPEEFFPTIAAAENASSLWEFDPLQNSYALNADLWLAPYVERRGINLTNDETVQIITALYPKMEGSGAVDVYIGAVDYIGGQPADIRWDPPIRFTPEGMYRVTCRVAGRRHAVRFQAVKNESVEEGVNTYASFRLTGYDIQYNQTGRR